jgi:hypothetical protein
MLLHHITTSGDVFSQGLLLKDAPVLEYFRLQTLCSIVYAIFITAAASKHCY